MVAPIVSAIGLAGLTAVVESFGLFFIRNSELLKAGLIYGIGVVALLSKGLAYEGIGMVNFLWNIFSTLLGFILGIYFFKEKVHYLQLLGVLVSLLGLGMIVLAPEE
jgi:multidrug transporter EmrE-like cation transporter